MNRFEFQELAALRIKDAKVLVESGRYEGAYYLAGYAIECALKACIAKRTKRFEFPPKEKIVRDYYTHDLPTLVKHAGLAADLQAEMDASAAFRTNWAVVKDWSEQSRYELSIRDTLARDLYSAVSSRSNGVLSWLRKRW